MKALWWEPSVLRVYSTIVLLGYVLSLVLVFSIVFLISGDELQSREREFLLYLLAALSLIYTGALASVGAFGFLREDGRHGVEALWRAAALMDDMKLVSFLVFFLLQATAHRVLVIGGAWEDEICSIIWTLGACGFFGQVGILLQA
ncbi:unnamed protein product [Spirodela intermedia]|uniref:Uncharacterized protein n=1 Tax=Spirodela intermedia TaxID=51605 RepID=A0A7I8IX66_SPIIN|nr:unnamed protein product [Spirodela intermedia]CAA6662274.1 unnamed protein product [Spirodela intermedia]